MASPSGKLAQSLQILKDLQNQGLVALRASDLSRTHREHLLKNGYIKEVMKGWYIPSRTDKPTGESMTWLDSFWAFCAPYLESRFWRACSFTSTLISMEMCAWCGI
jgi:hypothetical protein